MRTNVRGGLVQRARGGDRAAREALVIELLPLARRLARRYAQGAESYDDLEQVASVGLIKAVDRFDPTRGTSLSRFATKYIEGELRHHLRDNLGGPHVPRTKRSTATRATRAAGHLAGQLGRSPREDEIGARLNIPPNEVRDALEAAAALRRPRSLDEGLPDEANGAAHSLGDTDARLERVEDRHALIDVLASLPRSERAVVFLRLVAELPPGDVAARMGCSQRHATRLLARALERAHDVARRR
jgi:RNA polymerase sigma-B factor